MSEYANTNEPGLMVTYRGTTAAYKTPIGGFHVTQGSNEELDVWYTDKDGGIAIATIDKYEMDFSEVEEAATEEMARYVRQGVTLEVARLPPPPLTPIQMAARKGRKTMALKLKAGNKV